MTNPAPTIHGFPSFDVDPKEKAKDAYGIQFARAILWQGQSTTSGYDERFSKFVRNRKYGAGEPDIDKFKQRPISKDQANPTNVGDTSYLNVDRTYPQIIPKFVDLGIKRLGNRRYRPTCTAINPSMKSIQDEYRQHLLTNMMLKEKSDEMEQQTGIPIIPYGEYVPKDEAELEAHLQINFKIDYCIDLEEELQYIMNENNWKALERKLRKDLIVNKIAAFRTYYDHEYNPIVEYLDPNPAKLLIPYSEDQQFEKLAYAGYRHKILLYDLAIAAPQFTDEDLYNIAMKNQGMNGNTWGSNWGSNYSTYYNTFGRVRGWNNFMVDVMYFEFLTTDVKKWTATNKNGKSYLDKKSSDYTIPDETKNDKTLIERSVKNRYEGYWVVNTDFIYDYGLSKNIPRKRTLNEKNERMFSPDTTLSFKIIAPGILDMVNSSLVERMIPFSDNIYKICMKMQTIIDGIKNAGIAFDVAGLEAIQLGMGSGKMSPIEMTEMYQQIGSFPFSSRTIDGSPINGKVVESISNDEGGKVRSLIEAYEFQLNQIRNVTGINENSDASSVQPNQLVGTAQMAVQQSEAVTAELQEWFEDLMNRGLKDLGLMIQDCVENGRKLQAWKNIIGNESVNQMELAKGFYYMELGINIEFLPADQDIADLMRLMEMDIANGKLNSLDAFLIKEQAKTNIKHAALLMSLKEKEYAKQKMEEAAQNSQLQGQSAIQAAEAKTQGDIQHTQMEEHLLAAKLNLEFALKQKENEQLHKYKMEEIALMNSGKVELSHHTAATNMLTNNLKHDHERSMATTEQPAIAG